MSLLQDFLNLLVKNSFKLNGKLYFIDETDRNHEHALSYCKTKKFGKFDSFKLFEPQTMDEAYLVLKEAERLRGAPNVYNVGATIDPHRVVNYESDYGYMGFIYSGYFKFDIIDNEQTFNEDCI